MKRFKPLLGLAVLTLLPQATYAGHSTVPAMDLTLSVFNDARLPEKVLSDARERTTLVLLRAGLSLTWIDCGTPENHPANSGCAAISFPEHLSVRLVGSASPASEDTFGQSFLNAEGQGSYAYVYITAMRASRAAHILREGDLLGDVVAHEVGHLLLGASHGRSGIMAARWQVQELQLASKGLLEFSPEEAERLRSRYKFAIARNKLGTAAAPLTSGR